MIYCHSINTVSYACIAKYLNTLNIHAINSSDCSMQPFNNHKNQLYTNNNNKM